MTFAPSNPSKLTSLSIKLVGRSTGQTTNFIYLQNPATQQYDLVNTSPYSFTPSTVTVTISNFAQYIDGEGQVVLVTRAVSPPRYGSGAFNVGYDQALLLESY